MDERNVLAEKKGLVNVVKICSHCVQVNMVKNGISLYFTKDTFIEVADAFYSASTNLINFDLRKLFDQSNNN